MMYRTVRGASGEWFDDAVNRALAEGWTLYGSPYATGEWYLVDGRHKRMELAQAMTKGEPG